MKVWKPWSLVRECPRCGSFEIHRHRGGGRFKRLALQFVLVRRYSCMNCNSIYYGYLFCKRRARSNPASNDATIAMPFPKT